MLLCAGGTGSVNPLYLDLPLFRVAHVSNQAKSADASVQICHSASSIALDSTHGVQNITEK